MTRRLVITADDLGREQASSREILALLRERAVTACSLITVSADSAEAARGAAELGIAPHVHLTLTSERELAPWHPLSPGGSLHAGAGELPTARSLDPAALSRGEVVGELDAQLAWMHQAGLRPPGGGLPRRRALRAGGHLLRARGPHLERPARSRVPFAAGAWAPASRYGAGPGARGAGPAGRARGLPGRAAAADRADQPVPGLPARQLRGAALPGDRSARRAARGDQRAVPAPCPRCEGDPRRTGLGVPAAAGRGLARCASEGGHHAGQQLVGLTGGVEPAWENPRHGPHPLPRAGD
ncbi:MAG TPA: ChbG/HpnK family deacetylase, partial [Candidatus Brachybacterium merdigallinarum]|nr:ChbG/HpnK family deacetylase [Candidatus Brachybacterium merdigallinarum]